MAGWTKLHRDIQQHYLWNDKPFAKGQAWTDLILMANHKDNKFILGNELVEVERGSFITSEVKLMDRWGWSKSKVRAFLKLLESDSMIVKKADRKKTTLKIVNYDVWQDSQTIEEPQKNHQETTKELQKDTNKNDKNDKNVKNDKNKDKDIVSTKKKIEKKTYSDSVKLTDEQYEKLIKEFSEADTKDKIESLSLYVNSTGKKYKCHYSTILNWARKDKKNPKPITTKNFNNGPDNRNNFDTELPEPGEYDKYTYKVSE